MGGLVIPYTKNNTLYKGRDWESIGGIADVLRCPGRGDRGNDAVPGNLRDLFLSAV